MSILTFVLRNGMFRYYFRFQYCGNDDSSETNCDDNYQENWILLQLNTPID